MANAVVTVLSYPQIQAKGLRFRLVTLVLDNSYPSLGYPVAAADCNLTTDSDMYLIPNNPPGFVSSWDLSNQKLRMYKSTGSAAALTECSSTDCNGVTVQAFAIGY